MVVCLEQGAEDLHIWFSWCQCHPIISCFIKIQIGLTFLVPAYSGCPGKEAVKRVSVCLSVTCWLEGIDIYEADGGWWLEWWRCYLWNSRSLRSVTADTRACHEPCRVATLFLTISSSVLLMWVPVPNFCYFVFLIKMFNTAAMMLLHHFQKENLHLSDMALHKCLLT